MSRHFSEDKQMSISYMKISITITYHEQNTNKDMMRSYLTPVRIPTTNTNKCEEATFIHCS